MKIVVTGGGTSAPIDDVRAITNGSTGHFAAGITEAALELSASVRVWHVAPRAAKWPFDRHAHFDLQASDPYGEFTRLRELHTTWRRVRERLHRVPLDPPTVPQYAETLHGLLVEVTADVVFLAIAASDYAPEAVIGKLGSDAYELTLVCRRLPKVIAQVRDWAPGAYVVGFKLLSGVTEGELIAAARGSCERHRLDLVVANDWQAVRSGRHTVHLVRADGHTETIHPEMDPPRVLVERVLAWRGLAGAGR